MRGLGLALLFALVVAVYAPGSKGPFLLDDYENLKAIPAMKMSTLSFPSVRDALYAWDEDFPHRGLARVSFALNYYFAGRSFDQFAFKVTNVVIHVLNGLLVYWLSVLLLRRYAGVARPPSAQAGWSAMQSYLPLVVAALWLLHPIQLTSVLYVVQRMTSMAAFFVFLGLVVFVVGRTRLESGRRFAWTLMFGGLGGGVVLGYLCKQNAVLLPFFAFLVELFFFRHEALAQASRRRLYGFYALTVGLPVLAALAGLIIAWEAIAEGYLHRDFTPWERLLTQSRVLFFYLGLLVFPHIRAFGLYHDDLVLSTGLLTPWTTLPAVVLWVVLAGVALWGVRRRAIWSFGLLWYLVGHSLESSLLGLELVFEHRNYVPSFGVLFAAAYYLVWILDRVAGTRRLAYPVVGLLVVVLAFTTFTRASNWSDQYTVVETNLRNHPNSSRIHGEFATMNARYAGDTQLAYKHWARAAELNPSSVLELLEMQKTLAGVILSRSQQGATSDGGRNAPAPPRHFTAPLIMDTDYLWALDAIVAAEISSRLETRPVLMGNVAALRTLERCIRSKHAACPVLGRRAIDWYVLAIDNPRLAPKARAVLQLRLAKLYSTHGDMHKAVESATAAVAADPDHVVYRLELAALLLELGDLDAAERVIAEAKNGVVSSSIHRRILRDLEKDLARARVHVTGASPSNR